ncbi:hypothetical protein BKP35_07105 [Anaerobacillus arseniciselenatis]|uniref:Uncharacterized protein n=1 Tax=Anaerobacillus arseniciselenatis TaxID=85682 RepID=A0A1S2LP52_9BACI|nr:hypothetical protein [Anaerobacillus arseniciselenatis]OIJ14261.1 hypothetical protein BKP35_07105 [Anaerobacillus arseniciselenatis]
MYQIGDKIITDVEGQQKEAEIVEIEKVFRETDKKGDFVDHGLAILEGGIPSIPLPYEFHDDVLIVHYPESKIEENKDDNKVIYRCKDNAYTLQIDDHRIVVGEDQLNKR